MAEGGSDPPLMEGYGDSGEDHGGCGGNCGNEVVRDKSDEIQRDDKDIQNDNSQQNLQAHDQTNVSEVHSTTNTGDSGEDHGGSGGNSGNEVVLDKSDEIQQDDQDIQNDNSQQNLQAHGQTNVSEVHSTTTTCDSGEDHGGSGGNCGNEVVRDKSDEIQQDDQDIQNDNSQQNLQAHGQTNVSEVLSTTATGDSGEDHGGYGDNYGNKRVVDKSDEIQQDDQDIQNDNSQQNLQAHGQTNVSEVYSPTTTGFTIPLEDVTPEGPCNVDSIKKLSLQLKKDINSLNVYFEKCLPFVKIKNVSMGKQEKLCMEFFVNNKEELDLFRDNAKDKPQNNVSKKLQWFMHDQGYAGLLDFPRNVQFCLHISDELYQTTKTLITQSQNQYFQPANQDLSSSDRSTGTAAYTRPEDRSLMKSFIIYVPQDKHRDLEEVKLCIARKSTKMEHLRFGLYKCDATASDKSRYSYGITYGKKLSFNPTKWFEKTRTFDLEGSNQKEYLDRIWNSDNELQAHLLYRTYQYHHVHHDEKQLSMDIESACKKRKIQQHINTFVNGILDLLFEHELPFFVVAIIIGNLAYDQIDSVRMNMDRHATTVIAELSPLTLDKFSTSCRGYMPDVCHKLFRIAKAHKFSYVSEIKYFSKFLGNLKFQCLGKCVEQHVLMVTKSDSKEEFHNIYNELVELYIQNNCKDYLIYIQNLLKYSPVSFCVSAMISRQTENLGKETVVKVTKQGICENVGILSAIRNYDIQKLYSFWNEVCRFETARHHFKRVFEKHIMDLLDKVSVSDVSTSTMSKLFGQSDGLFEDNTSQENLLKTLVTRSTSQMTLSLFTDLYSTKKFGHMYSSISLEIFISWLDKSKKCWSDDKKLCTKFVDVLKITADRKDVQSQVFGHFIGIKSSSAFELVSFWREHRDCFKSYPPAEDVFIHHIKEALLKDTKCKPLKILEKLKNSHQILNVDSRSTAVIVSSILDAFCSLKATGSVQDLFKPIMKHIEIWEIVVTGRGDYIHIVHAGNVCQSALAFFSVLAESLIKRKLSYNFCETIMQSKQHDIHVLNQILIKHKAPDMSTVWGKIKGIYEDEMTKLKCVHDVLKRTFDHIKAETLPEKFYDILNDQEKELRDKDLSDDGISDLWHGKCALADYCIKLNILTQSRLFWNVNVETISTLHAKYKPFKEYLDYDRVCDFLESVFKIGQEEYITTLDEIENSPTLNVAKIKVIFKNATDVERLEIERDLAKQVLKSNTCEEPFEVLKRLTEIDTVSNDIRAIKSAVMAFGLHNEESQHNMLIDEDFFKRKDFDSLTFKELKKQLQNLFKLKADSSEILFEILNQIGSSKALISFLKEIVEEDIRNLTDAVDDISEQYVQASTVASLIEIKTFLQPLLTEKIEHTSAFICAIKTRIKRYGDKADDIPLKINTCIGSLHQLRALYKNVANRGEQTKETIQKILSEGSFNVYLNETTHKVDVTCSCKSNQSVYTELTLVDLRSRALLLMNSERGKGDKTCSNEHFARFVQYIDQSLEIKLLVKGLYLAGHTGYEKFEMSKDGEKLIDEKLELVKKLQIWEERLRKQRETFYLLNFLQSVQLHTFFRYMTTGEGLQQVEMMLKFIHPKFPLAEWKACSRLDESKAGSELEELGMSLIQTIKKDLFEEERVLREQSTMKNVRETVQKGKMSIVRLEETSVFVVKTVLALYENTTDSFPEPHQVLFCSKDTEWDEIQILLNRCIFSRNYHERDLLYCLANVELLPNEMQFRLVDSLRGLQSSAQYLLCVVFRGSLNHLFFEEFAEHVTPIQPWSTKKTEDIFRKKYSETLTISSEIAGLGKTTRIKRLARTKKQGVLSLHISGTVLKKVLVQQLNQLNLKPYHALHLDVASVDDVISLDTFLFELLFLRYVTTGTESFSLKNECIYLEIANTINDTLRNSLQTAMCFRREHLVWNDFQDFVVSLEINSPVQVVCAYFDKLEIGEMDKADILLTNEHVPLPSTRCRSLLVKYIQLDEEMSFVVVNSLLKVLADQLKKMSCSSFFKTERLQDMAGGKNNIKSNLVKTLTAASKEFAIRSIQSCREGQVCTMSSEHASSMLQVEKMIRWEDSNHLIYVFHSQNIQTISAMYRKLSKVPAEIKSLFGSQMKRNLEVFRKLDQEQLQSILQKVSRTNPLDLTPCRLKELAEDYVLTPDNLLKMVLIVMRIRARVPVVVMGETGCGKTSLIRYLANICEVEFDVLNIHAGTELSQIVSKLEENNDNARSCLLKERWLFLDEINTSENISVISDVICHHRLAGKQLSPNLVLLSACNPYRKRSAAAICTAGLKAKVKTDEMSKLVYRVLPLPQQLVDYVWDFGNLSNKDEKLYIHRMTHGLFKENKQLLDIFVDLLTMSQEFVRSTETNCNVSLRDVQRCQTLVKWFSNKLKEKKLHYKKKYNPDLRVQRCRTLAKIISNKLKEKKLDYKNVYNPDLRAVIMAIAHCYYNRLDSDIIRNNFLQKMAKVFNSHNENLQSNDIKQVIILEQRDILERMDIPLGTALNQSLQENVFMILVCILNKIPIFVVGKPGCSKSLAMQVIRSNLRGKDSTDDFFKTLPQLYCVSFQGSESSTSDGIIKVFEKAENYQNSNSDDVLSVVILDEIGLAEVSRFNPLKVLHSLLEPGGKPHPNVAVVGISNWALDASKMNRAIHLSKPDMNSDELFETGMWISLSFECLEDERKNLLQDSQSNFSTESIVNHLEYIANAYYNYCTNLSFKNFHGLRDYYALVKYVAKECTASKESLSIPDIIKKGLERNFGGLPAEKHRLYESFNKGLEISEVHRKVIDIIEENITDHSARHLMLITSGHTALGTLQQKLDKIGRKRHEIILGSQFEEDLTDGYNYRILSRIILCMEEGIVLILKDLDTIYGSLYDMLNQNYTVIGKTKNCRVALGHYSNPICRVAESFRCIVLIDKSKLNYQDPPFLNRFEKQILSVNHIISSKQQGLIKYLDDWFKKLGDLGDERFNEQDIFPIFSEDLFASLVLKLETDNDQNAEEIVRRCKSELLGIMKADAVLRLSTVSGADMSDEAGEMKQSYFDMPLHGGLLEFYEWDRKDCGKENRLRIIFTFTSVHSNAIRLLKGEKGEEIQTENVGSFKSEKQLSSRIEHFWFQSRASLLCLQCSVRDDGQHVSLVMSVIERFRTEFLEKQADAYQVNKHVYLILHISRTVKSSVVTHINFLSNWKLTTLDSIEIPKVKLPEMCENTLIDTIKAMRPLSNQIADQLFWSFTRIKYNNSGRSIQSIQKLLEKIKLCDHFLEIIDNYLWEILRSNNDNKTDWQVQVAFDKRLLGSSSGMVDALEIFLQKQIQAPLTKIIYQLEVHGVLDSFLIKDNDTYGRRKLWENFLMDQHVFDISCVPQESGPESYECLTPDLSFRTPFFKHMYDAVEETRTDFLQTISLIKQRLMSEDKELTDELTNDVIRNHQSTVVMILPKVDPMYDNLSYDYLEDFCNVLSYSCVGFTHKDRMNITRHLVLQKANLDYEDFFDVVIKLHSMVWMKPFLFSLEIQIISIYSEVFKLDISEFLQTCGQIGGRLPEMINTEKSRNRTTTSHDECEVSWKNSLEKDEVNDNDNINRANADIISLNADKQSDCSSFGGDYVGDDKNYFSMVMSDQGRCIREDEVNNINDGIPFSYSTKAGQHKTSEIFVSSKPDSMGKDTVKQESYKCADEPLGKQERTLNIDFSNENSFVQDICKNMLPCHKFSDMFSDIRRWSNTAGRILPLVSLISNKPVELDMLRFCDMITEHLILPLGIADGFLFELADGFLNSGEFLNDQVFHCVLRVIEAANGKSVIECQRVFADYMMKGLVNEPSDDSLRHLYSLIIDSKLPDGSCSFLKLIIDSAINYEIDVNDDKDILQMLLKGHNSMDSPGLLSLNFFKHMESCLMKLSKQNRHHDPFVVLLIDSFEEIFLTHFKESEDSDAASLFLTAHATLVQHIISVTYLASLGCYKAFMKSAIENGEVKKEYYNELNIIFTHGPPYKSLPFFNILRGELSSHRFIEKVADMKSILPNLKGLSFTLSNMFLDNCPFGLKMRMKVDISTEKYYIKLMEHVTTVDDLLNVYDVLFRDYYVPQSFQALNDNQNLNADQLATEIEKHETLDNCHKMFMLCLLGRRDFKIKQFMHTPETTSRQYLMNITLTLLFSMLLSHKTNTPLSLLQTCILKSMELKEMFLPGCNNATTKQAYGLSENNNMVFTSCSCGNRIYLESFDESAACIICGKILKITEEACLFDDTDEIKGLLFTEQMKQWDFEQKSLPAVAYHLLIFFMKGCLLGSYAIGVSDGPTLEEVVGAPEIDIEQHLNLERHWENLLRLLNLGDYHLFILIHSFIFNNEKVLCLNHDTLRSPQDRNEWEVKFSEAVERMVIDRFDLIKQRSAQAQQNLCADTNLDEFEASIGEFNDLGLNNKIALFRMTTSASVENFWAELSCCTFEFPFLNLVTHREHEINLVSNLLAIIQWHSTVVSTISYMFKKHDLLEMKVSQVVYHELCKTHRVVLENTFEALCTSWCNVCTYQKYEKINWSSKMSECLILDNNSQLFQGLNLLVGIQNNIIQLAMNMSVGNSCLGLFAKSTKGHLGWQVAVPEVKVIEIKENMLMRLNRSIKDTISIESQCDHRYGYGRRVIYNFYEIERSVVSSVLVGKVFIKTDIVFLPKVAFSDELFKNVAMLLSDVKSNIKQENLSPDLQRAIQNEHEKNPKMVPQLLIHTGMMLPLLKRTKGDADETVKDYVHKMKNLLQSHSFNLPFENLKLCHIVGFYELLEVLHADLVFVGLEKKYKMMMEIDENKLFQEMAEEQHEVSEVLLKTLKIFIHRCLDKRDTEDENTERDIKRPLSYSLSDLSLWPDQYVHDGDIVVGETRVKVATLIPEAVTLGHICNLVTVLQNVGQSHENVNRYMQRTTSQPSRTSKEKGKTKLKSRRDY